MPTALALSPHLDDAAFSAGASLARLVEAGWRVVVATVFTASVAHPSGFALACQLDKGLPAEVDYMALRRAEDAVAMTALGAAAEWLGLPEAPHRGYGSAPALFGPPRPDDAVAIGPAVLGRIDALRPDLLLAPQGIGGHVDHVLLVRALHVLAPACPILWWRDFPYAARGTAPREPFADRMGARPEIAVAVTPESADRRRLACRAYASQLGFQFGGSAGLDAALAASPPSERFRLTGTANKTLAGLLRRLDA